MSQKWKSKILEKLLLSAADDVATLTCMCWNDVNCEMCWDLLYFTKISQLWWLCSIILPEIWVETIKFKLGCNLSCISSRYLLQIKIKISLNRVYVYLFTSTATEYYNIVYILHIIWILIYYGNQMNVGKLHESSPMSTKSF